VSWTILQVSVGGQNILQLQLMNQLTNLQGSVGGQNVVELWLFN